MFKDMKLVSCNTSLWFGCVEDAVDGRTPANQKQNKDYPKRILKLYKPRYDAAGW